MPLIVDWKHMRNSLRLPIVALCLAVAIAVATIISWYSGDQPEVFHLTELEIGMSAWALLLAVFGIQGIVSVISEGTELHPGKAPPRLTDTLTAMIVLFSLLLLFAAIVLLFGLIEEFSTEFIGTVAGLGSIMLALLLVFYKEAFLGDEARFDDRDDGIPW